MRAKTRPDQSGRATQEWVRHGWAHAIYLTGHNLPDGIRRSAARRPRAAGRSRYTDSREIVAPEQTCEDGGEIYSWAVVTGKSTTSKNRGKCFEPSDTGVYFAGWFGILAIESPAERGGNGVVHRPGEWGTIAGEHQGEARAASALGAGFSGYARGAGISATHGRRVFQHSGHGRVSRQAETFLHRRHSGDGEPAPLWALESPHGSSANRHAAE
jgi:hypothetical protein